MLIGILYFSFIEYNKIMIVYFALFEILVWFYFPKYFNSRYKRYYLNYVKENYKNRIGIDETLEFTDSYIKSTSKIGEGQVNLTEIEYTSEIPKYLILKISTGEAIIIPTKGIENIDELKSFLIEENYNYKNELDWKWG